MADPLTQTLAIDEGGRILAGTKSGRVLLFSVRDPGGRAEYAGLEGRAIRALSVSPGAALILAFDAGGRGLVWDRTRREILEALQSPDPVIQCAISGPGSYVTLGNGGAGRVWSREESLLTAQPICDPPEVPLSFQKFGLSGDGSRLVMIDSFRWRVWDRHTSTVTSSHKPIDGLHVDNPSGDIGVSANGRFYYAYWDTDLVMDTADASVVREGSIVVDPITTALSNDGRFLAIGAAKGVVVVAGPDGAVFRDQSGAAVIDQVSIGATGQLATFVDEEGSAGCIDVENRSLLIGRERMAEIIG